MLEPYMAICTAVREPVQALPRSCVIHMELGAEHIRTPRIPAAERALKGRNCTAMGLDPSTETLMDLEALKGRNRKPCSYSIMDKRSAGHYFAPSGLNSVWFQPTMGQDPSLYFFAPLGLCDCGKPSSWETPMRLYLWRSASIVSYKWATKPTVG